MKQLLVEYGTPALVSVLGALIAFALKELRAYLAAKGSESKVAATLARMLLVVETVVDSIEQTVRPEVAKASADGTLTKEEGVALRDLALAKTLKFLGEGGVKSLSTALGIPASAITEYLLAQIEAAILRSKPK